MVAMKGGPGAGDPGQITWTGVPMRATLLRAYDIKNYQLVAPKWVDTERYDIAAKIPAGANQEQFRAMLRHLLQERFKMGAREETKEAPVYALLVAKNGSKLKESIQTTVLKILSLRPNPAAESAWKTAFHPCLRDQVWPR